MMKSTLRMHPMMDKFINTADVQEQVEGLIRGNSIENIPPKMFHQIISALTAKRKDAILHGETSLANKIDVILGEIQRGPEKFEIDSCANPVKARKQQRSLRTRSIGDPETIRLQDKTTRLLEGAEKIDQLDTRTRQSITPVLKKDRILQLSRANYPVSHSIDVQMDDVFEYSTDSRRLGPKLQKVAAIQKKLDAARARYERTRQSCIQRRRDYTEMERAAEAELEEKLHADMLEYGSHLPTTLPLEYQKVSNKVLNARVKEEKGARIRMYDDAAANHRLALEQEKIELERNNQAFARAFNANREVMLKSQERQREGFREVWRRKKDKVTADLAAEMEQSRRAVENLEKELANAVAAQEKELGRIHRNAAYSSSAASRRVNPTFGI